MTKSEWMDKWRKRNPKPEDGTAVSLPYLKENLNVQGVCEGSAWGLRLIVTRVIANICERWPCARPWARSFSESCHIQSSQRAGVFYPHFIENRILEKSRHLLNLIINGQIKVLSVLFVIDRCSGKIKISNGPRMKGGRGGEQLLKHCVFLPSSLLYHLCKKLHLKIYKWKRIGALIFAVWAESIGADLIVQSSSKGLAVR